MSNAAIRTALADAANEVLGERRCSAYYRQATRPGDAWVSYARRDLDDTRLGYLASWEVRVVLPQDLAKAEVWVDDKSDALVRALAPHLVITAVVVVTLVADGGNVPGLVIEGVREHIDKEEVPAP